MAGLDPERFRALGYRAIDMIAEQLANLPDGPTRRPVPTDIRHRLERQPIPEHGADPFTLLDRVEDEVLAYPMGNPSPRFFAWVNSTPSHIGILGDMIASAMSPSAAGGDQAATYVERAALTWIKDMLGFPQDAQGLLVSGGSMANLTCLAVMRHVMSGGVRENGMMNEPAPMVVYTSQHGHSCIEKAVHMLGIGSRNLRAIPLDSQYRMDITALREAIAADRAAGLRPCLVVGHAGTTNTGAVDDLGALADVAARERLWLHVDAAYGGFFCLTARGRRALAGIERADSVTLDPHKGMFLPYGTGCLLARSPAALRRAHGTHADYLPPMQDDPEFVDFCELSPELSRDFRGLRVWLPLKLVGVGPFRRALDEKLDLAHACCEALRGLPGVELVAPPQLSLFAFRHVPAGAEDGPMLDAHNRRLLDAINRRGRVYVTPTVVGGRFVVRVCVLSFRTHRSRVEAAVEDIRAALTEVGGER